MLQCPDARHVIVYCARHKSDRIFSFGRQSVIPELINVSANLISKKGREARGPKAPCVVHVARASERDWPVLQSLMMMNFAEDSFMRHTPADTEIHTFEQKKIREVLKTPVYGDRSLLLVAHVDGEGAGYLFAEKVGTKRQPHVASFHMWISGRHRGKGIGSKLMSDVISWARNNREIRKLELDVMSCNEGGIKLYKSFGFREEGRRKETAIKDGQYCDLIQMALSTITNQDS